jgi:hypothetical protein
VGQKVGQHAAKPAAAWAATGFRVVAQSQLSRRILR